MEKNNIKRGRGRPRILTDAERKNNKTKCMLEKEWYCEICNTGINYTLAGKHCHMKTKKHIKKQTKIIITNNIIEKMNHIANNN